MSAITALAALPAAALVIATLLRSPLARRLVAAPSADRWHERDTPTFGGVGIFAGFVAGTAVAVAAGAVDASPELLGILGACALLHFAGLVDDARSLNAAVKLGVQFAAAGLALASGVSVEIVGNDVVAGALTLAWLVGMTNAFNLLDNMDGLAASLAVLACAFFAIAASTVQEDALVLVLALALGAAAVAFLPFNLRPRRSAAVFMGDSGSQVLGFALAALGLQASWQVAGTTVATLLLPLLVLAVPILDTALVTVVRLLEGRPIYQGGRDHASHRLVYGGLSETRAVVLLAAVSAALGATSLGYTVLDDARVTLIGVLVTFAVLVQFASFLADVERGGAPVQRGRSPVTRLLVVHRRRLIEVVVDFALVTAAFTAAYQLRVWDTGSPWNPYVFESALPVILAARYLTFIPFGLYRGVWRYAGARDAVNVVAAVLVSEAIAVAFLALTRDWSAFPRAVFVIDALFCMVLVGASRFGERALARLLTSLRERGTQRRTLVVGAGRGGRSLLRELRETPGETVVGFVDDDPGLRGRRLQGVAVLGGTAEIERLLASVRPDAVLVTIPDAPRERLDHVVRACAAAEVPCHFVRREIDVDPLVALGATSD